MEKKCKICGKDVKKNSSQYCDSVFFKGTKNYNKQSCAYKGRHLHQLGYNKKRHQYCRHWSQNRAKTNINFAFKRYKQNAKNTGKVFEITEEEFLQYWNAHCFYCGEKIQGAGIDRLENSKGYVLGNIVACCNACNFAKGHRLSSEEFISLAKKITKNNEEKTIKSSLEKTLC